MRLPRSLIAVGVVALIAGSAPPVATAAAPIRVEGAVRWAVEWSTQWDGDGHRSFDLDIGAVAPSWYRTGDAILLFCSPGRCGWVVGSYQGLQKRSVRPTERECRTTTRYKSGYLDRGSAPNGTWLCARTGEGRYARVRILHWPTRSELYFTFRYLTWGDPLRVIDLEEDAALQIKRDGQKVSEIPVTPGETIRFKITNTAGFAHSFWIGPSVLIEADETEYLTGVDDFVSGTKDVYWTVPDDLSGYGFGCTVPGHYTLMNGTFT